MLADRQAAKELASQRALPQIAGVSEDPVIVETVAPRAPRRRVFVLGATGTIGRATVRELVRRGHEVVCFGRVSPETGGPLDARDSAGSSDRVDYRYGAVTDPASLQRDGFRGEPFEVLVSCMASRTGAPEDAWAVDYHAHVLALEAARRVGVSHVVQLSALCVQKPRLAFQHAKLAFEQQLQASGVDYTIIRPTAFFKSLCGQVARVRRGKPFLVFGDGTLTACKPISDDDLASYIADCLIDAGRRNRVLPIGGPGDAITPLQQAEHLFALLRRPPLIRHVPVSLLSGIIGVLGCAGRLAPRLAAKAELARIGRYYATESMLVWDAAAGRYDAALTPSTGTETLFDFYERLIQGATPPPLRDHAVF